MFYLANCHSSGNLGLMSILYGSMLRRLHFAAAMLAILVGIGAAIDLHSHETGLHAPIVCSICALENAISGGYAPAHVWAPELAPASSACLLPQSRLFVAVYSDSTLIRAPPLV